MLRIRKSAERGHRNHGWLDTFHSFSFNDYHDPEFMGFRALRVINEDVFGPGAGFPMHPHANMEIITYVIDGALMHGDTMGNETATRANDIQRMSAGAGILHSEFNESSEVPAHLLQIWLKPDKQGYKPSYEQKTFPPESKTDRLTLVVSPDGRDGSARMNQDASLYASMLGSGKSVRHDIAPGRAFWLQLISGRIDVNGQAIEKGDAVYGEDENSLEIRAVDNAHFLLFDLA